jgi:hypothetical protein
VNFGAQEFGEGISRIQGILENVNMPCHDMQPNALLIWPKFITAKSGCYKLSPKTIPSVIESTGTEAD